MNYIWELAIKAIEKDIDQDSIYFKYGMPFSGYMELSFTDINEKNVLSEVEINPFYRFYEIFKELFEPNMEENPEIVDVIHDLVIHHLKDIDVLMGMSKREYHINFVIEDLKKGCYGSYIQENINLFNLKEQKIIANNLLIMQTTAESVHLLKKTVSNIFNRAYIFSNAFEKDEIVFYLRTKQTKKKTEQIEVIKYLFLPFKCNVEVYWEHIFGVIGVDELMRLDGIMNYSGC